ncbi:ferroxidase FET3 Ecym_3427 [Eremothecium cymbalariae DBVPG|uniref:Iron transport multicopper oxidase FET3 n=1 Tax=Eremothecium cymbalariae (strain CBS 270.75 / DBVPG 7215 / KCTC 17166 / NRRL Y-17582) TaxID=931890 RepID=G8JRZ4_ERECY|nr:Hypothetical protein Ecym_3427 [Eremothecium cymbalariae DBVPG\
MVWAKGLFVLLNVAFSAVVRAETHTFHWKTGIGKRNLDGLKEREVITCNGEFPWPDIRVKRGDRVEVFLTNGFSEWNTSLHFHGMFQNGTSQMDGPEMVTQCPIAPNDTMLYNFTVEHNKGTFWYHSHTPGHYQDGMKGLFIIEEDEFPYEYDKEVTIQLSEWYHELSANIMPRFLNLYNPTGAEPIPQSLLINNTMNLTWNVEPDTTYLLRIVNTGGFVSQYFWIEDHDLTVVEVDGVFVEKNTTNMLYITTAQRYSVLLHTKSDTSKNYAIMQCFDENMLDATPPDLVLNHTSYLTYNADAETPEEQIVPEWDYLDDFYLTPIGEDKIEAFGEPDNDIVVHVEMDNLLNGVNYAFFNNITYTEPKVPTLMTVLSAGEQATNPVVYGSNTHTYVLGKDEVVQIVLNNHDTGRHPFHLHGHTFQVVARGPPAAPQDGLDNADPIEYNAEAGESEIREYPMTRDTVYVNGKSYLVLRFKANNPGVWFFHCHIEWHMMQGLSLTLVEAPEEIQKSESQQLTETAKNACINNGISPVGNAAGNSKDFLDLAGQNVQQKAIPAGFTPKGIVAMFFSCLVAILGLITIAVYGLMDVQDIEEKVIEDLGVDVSNTESIDEHGDSISTDNKN